MLTVKDNLRQPVYLVLLLSSCCLIGIQPIVSLFVFREQEKLVNDGSLAVMLLMGMICAILCADRAVNREIESGAVLLTLAKPIHRSAYICAKIIGNLIVDSAFIWVTGIAALCAVRIAYEQFALDKGILLIYFSGIASACLFGVTVNYFKRMSFFSATSIAMVAIYTAIGVIVYWMPRYESAGYTGPIIGFSGNTVKAIILILFASWIMSIMATCWAIRLNMVGNLTLCTLFFLLGLVSDYLYSRIRNISEIKLLIMIDRWSVPILITLIICWLLLRKRCRRANSRRSDRAMLDVAFGTLCVTSLILAVTENVTVEGNPAGLAAHLIYWLIYAVKSAGIEVVHTLTPNWQLFWLTDALASDRTIPIIYISFGFLYVLGFYVFFFMLSILILEYRDLTPGNAL